MVSTSLDQRQGGRHSANRRRVTTITPAPNAANVTAMPTTYASTPTQPPETAGFKNGYGYHGGRPVTGLIANGPRTPPPPPSPPSPCHPGDQHRRGDARQREARRTRQRARPLHRRPRYGRQHHCGAEVRQHGEEAEEVHHGEAHVAAQADREADRCLKLRRQRGDHQQRGKRRTQGQFRCNTVSPDRRAPAFNSRTGTDRKPTSSYRPSVSGRAPQANVQSPQRAPDAQPNCSSHRCTLPSRTRCAAAARTTSRRRPVRCATSVSDPPSVSRASSTTDTGPATTTGSRSGRPPPPVSRRPRVAARCRTPSSAGRSRAPGRPGWPRRGCRPAETP